MSEIIVLSFKTLILIPRKLAEGQASLHQRQVSELESALSSHKDRVRKYVTYCEQ